MTSPITATLVGGPTLHLTYAGRTFLTDPTFDEPGAYAPRGGVTLTKLVGPAVAARAQRREGLRHARARRLALRQQRKLGGIAAPHPLHEARVG